MARYNGYLITTVGSPRKNGGEKIYVQINSPTTGTQMATDNTVHAIVTCLEANGVDLAKVPVLDALRKASVAAMAANGGSSPKVREKEQF